MSKRTSLARWLKISLMALSAVLTVGIAVAQDGSDMARMAAYLGADRQQVLIEGAKREGTLSFYTSIPTPDIAPVIDAFSKKYSVRVSLWRSGSEQILQRTVSEAHGGRPVVDILDTNGPEMEALYREQLLQKVETPAYETLRPEALQPHRAWTTTRVNVFAQAYNTKLVTKEERPGEWSDLLDPKWKGKLGIEANDLDWFSAVIGQFKTEEQGLDLFRQIVRRNGVSVRRGHTLMTNLVVAGEIPLALTVYHFEPEAAKKKGAPIDWYSIGKVVVRPNGSGVPRRAPHPHAALLFYDFMLTEGQQFLAQRDIEVTSRSVESAISHLPQQMISSAEILDSHTKWNRLYTEMFVNQSR